MPAKGQPGNTGNFWKDFAWGFEKGFTPFAEIGKFFGLKKGGKINRTGVYKLHKGERVLNAKQTKAWDKAHRKKKTKKSGAKKKPAAKGRRKKRR